MATVLETINYSLRLVGQQEILNTNSTLGTLCRSLLQSATDTVIMETRHQSTLQFVDSTVSVTDYSLPGAVLPTRMYQLLQVFARQGTNDWKELTHTDFESLAFKTAHFHVNNNSIFFSKAISRPFTVRLSGVVGIDTLSLTDASIYPLAPELEPAVWHTLASLLAVSFVDDPNASAIQARAAEMHIQRIRNRKGTFANSSVKWRYN